MTQTPAPLAMQCWPRTCSIEIAGLSEVDGTESLLRTLEEDAKNFDIRLHWGQRNGWPMKQIEKCFGDGPSSPLFRWREALSDLSEHGRWATFSTQFTKFKGLEITAPIIESFSASPTDGCQKEWATVNWNAVANPPETKAILVQTRQADGNSKRIELPTLQGSAAIEFGPGRSTLKLVLQRDLNGRRYEDSRILSIRGFSTGVERPPESPDTVSHLQ